MRGLARTSEQTAVGIKVKMTYNINRFAFLLFLFLTSTVAATAQDDVEYRMEIGAGVAATAYQGDFNSGLFKGMQPGGAVVFRRVLTPYMALRATAMYTQVRGDATSLDTYYPDIAATGYSFKNTLGDLSVTYEYNFLPYGTGRDYRGAQRLTPFVSLGIGMTYVKCDKGTVDFSENGVPETSKSVVSANIPLGVGVKYKVGARLNLSLDWQMHFSMTDYIDGVKDPYRIGSTGVFKNTDCYSTLTLALTYSFSAKCPDCQKAR